MTKLHEGLFVHQEEAKSAMISGRPILSYSRKMLASYILWMDDMAGGETGVTRYEDEEVPVSPSE